MSVKEIASEDLKKLLDEGADLLLVDLLGEKSYESLHLPQAVSVPTGDDFVARIEELTGGDHEKMVVLYGSAFKDDISTRHVEELQQSGFTDAYDFRGGLKDWAAELFPLEGLRAPKK